MAAAKAANIWEELVDSFRFKLEGGSKFLMFIFRSRVCNRNTQEQTYNSQCKVRTSKAESSYAATRLSGVGRATGYGLDDRGPILGEGKIFLFSTAGRRARGLFPWG
jgi:hypothetical protein